MKHTRTEVVYVTQSEIIAALKVVGMIPESATSPIYLRASNNEDHFCSITWTDDIVKPPTTAREAAEAVVRNRETKS